MAQTVLSMEADASGDLFLFWLIPHIIFWILCAAAVTAKCQEFEVYALGVPMLAVFSLFGFIVACMIRRQRSEISSNAEDEWPGSVPVGLGYLLFIIVGHILCITLTALWCLASAGCRYLSSVKSMLAPSTSLPSYSSDGKSGMCRDAESNFPASSPSKDRVPEISPYNELAKYG
ncbi:hypothetical protein LTR56_013256 [Elasticomyces elasticus]|nr:hypothetical protein LTR56_013256 [Elasticomyces elasticus]KAK3650113.1 hypothetical protein LTR22_012708 [Elasticomyces elasticus]KAK4920050.1 hypothetical protein LTR49_012311 [Elasticomyces elasticus]KAK5757225.1 hypothetical protein LTS12_012741 [Elasticomyces elasticus]